MSPVILTAETHLDFDKDDEKIEMPDMDEEEFVSTGGKINIGKSFKKFGNQIKNVSQDAGKVIVPELKKSVRPILKKATTMAINAIGAETGLPVGTLLKPATDNLIDAGFKKTGGTKRGFGLKGSDEMKERMRKLREMRKPKA